MTVPFNDHITHSLYLSSRIRQPDSQTSSTSHVFPASKFSHVFPTSRITTQMMQQSVPQSRH
jgi:hypothetical protein